METVANWEHVYFLRKTDGQWRVSLTVGDDEMAAFGFSAPLPIVTFGRRAIFKPVPSRNRPGPPEVSIETAKRRRHDHRADGRGMDVDFTDEMSLNAVF